MFTSPLADVAATAPSIWANMWTPDFPWWHFVLRGFVIYFFVLILLRITGKRQVGQLAPFDLVLLLVLSNAVQNAMNGGDNSVTGGIVSACTLVGLNYFVGYLTFKSKFLEALIEGRPVVLIHNGVTNHRNMNCVRMTMHELNAALREAGCCGAHEVQLAVLENSGNITVIPKHGHQNGETLP
ncbi:MAG TPA: YetF domain-containing protein [Phycisphaerae bacterium]|nr:YetF domain-containing protein [Phycisphaerae bacterium]